MIISYNEQEKLEKLFVGRSIIEIIGDSAVLDNGKYVRFVGNEGNGYGSGDFYLDELNGCENIITSVIVDEDAEHYYLFVLADNKKINLASFAGDVYEPSYYGSGFYLAVTGDF